MKCPDRVLCFEAGALTFLLLVVYEDEVRAQLSDLLFLRYSVAYVGQSKSSTAEVRPGCARVPESNVLHAPTVLDARAADLFAVGM